MKALDRCISLPSGAYWVNFWAIKQLQEALIKTSPLVALYIYVVSTSLDRDN
jgi:hypothetical protein